MQLFMEIKKITFRGLPESILLTFLWKLTDRYLRTWHMGDKMVLRSCVKCNRVEGM